MTTRVQALRSSTTGALPAAGTRLPGELWTNFADLQAGVIDASKNAQKLVAVRYFATTANYAAGDYVVQAGQLYRAKASITAGAFNATQWTLTGGSVLVSDTAPPSPTPGDMWFDSAGGQLYVYYNDGSSSQWVIAVNQNIASGIYLPLTGGAMTGPVSNLTLNADPTVVAGAATKRYVDAGDAAINASLIAMIGDNRIINGDMRIDQRWNGSTGTASGYMVDRWAYFPTQTGKITWGRRGQNSANGFPYALGMQTTTAFTPAATDTFQLNQFIEADMIGDFAWSTSNAQPFTLSFWANSSLTGTFSGAVLDYALTRSYPFTFSLPTANTWTKIVIIIPGDTGGSWVMAGNAGALTLNFDLGSGANYRGAAGAWISAGAPPRGVTGAVNLVATLNATFYLTGVKLEIGSVATAYNRQSLAKSMADCQRYYQTGQLITGGYLSAAAQATYWSSLLPVAMRAAPTIVATPVGFTNCTFGSAGVYGSASVWIQAAAIATGAFNASASFTVSAEL